MTELVSVMCDAGAMAMVRAKARAKARVTVTELESVMCDAGAMARVMARVIGVGETGQGRARAAAMNEPHGASPSAIDGLKTRAPLSRLPDTLWILRALQAWSANSCHVGGVKGVAPSLTHQAAARAKADLPPSPLDPAHPRPPGTARQQTLRESRRRAATSRLPPHQADQPPTSPTLGTLLCTPLRSEGIRF